MPPRLLSFLRVLSRLALSRSRLVAMRTAALVDTVTAPVATSLAVQVLVPPVLLRPAPSPPEEPSQPATLEASVVVVRVAHSPRVLLSPLVPLKVRAAAVSMVGSAVVSLPSSALPLRARQVLLSLVLKARALLRARRESHSSVSMLVRFALFRSRSLGETRTRLWRFRCPVWYSSMLRYHNCWLSERENI